MRDRPFLPTLFTCFADIPLRIGNTGLFRVSLAPTGISAKSPPKIKMRENDFGGGHQNKNDTD